MMPQTHLAAATFAGLMMLFFGVPHAYVLLFVAWSVLIDLDHAMYLVIGQRTISPGKALELTRLYLRKREAHLYVFHSPEFLAALAVISVPFTAARVVLAATVLHTVMDTVSMHRFHKDFRWYLRWSVLCSTRK